MTADVDFMNAVGDLMASWRLSRATGRVYGALLLEDEPVSLDRLGEIVGLSKGQISMSSRELVSWGLARAIPQSGSRRVLVEAAGGLETLLAASQQRTRKLVVALRDGRRLLDEGSVARLRLDDVIDLFDGYIDAGDHILRQRSGVSPSEPSGSTP